MFIPVIVPAVLTLSSVSQSGLPFPALCSFNPARSRSPSPRSMADPANSSDEGAADAESIFLFSTLPSEKVKSTSHAGMDFSIESGRERKRSRFIFSFSSILTLPSFLLFRTVFVLTAAASQNLLPGTVSHSKGSPSSVRTVIPVTTAVPSRTARILRSCFPSPARRSFLPVRSRSPSVTHFAERSLIEAAGSFFAVAGTATEAVVSEPSTKMTFTLNFPPFAIEPSS